MQGRTPLSSGKGGIYAWSRNHVKLSHLVMGLDEPTFRAMSLTSLESPYGMPGVEIEIMLFSMPSLSMNSRADSGVQLTVPHGRCNPVSSAQRTNQVPAEVGLQLCVGTLESKHLDPAANQKASTGSCRGSHCICRGSRRRIEGYNAGVYQCAQGFLRSLASHQQAPRTLYYQRYG